MTHIFGLNIDIFLLVVRYLSVPDILNIDQTCKHMHDIINLRGVWHLVLTTHIQKQNIPIPGLARQPIESLAVSELKRLALRALRLRRNWTSLSPVIKNQYSLVSDVLPSRLGVVAMKFLTRSSRYLLSLVLPSSIDSLFCLQCWDLVASPPICVAIRGVEEFGFFVVNEDGSSPATLAIQSPGYIELLAIDFSGVDPISAFSVVARIPRRMERLQSLRGSLVLTKDAQHRLHLWDAERPGTRLVLRNSGIQPGEPLEVIIQDKFVIVIRRRAVEIFGIPHLALVEASTTIFPVADYRWEWELDRVSVAHQISHTAGLLAIGVLIRFGGLLPEPVNLLHYYVLYPNNSYDASRPVGENNVPYEVTPTHQRTIVSPILMFAMYHIVIGRRGTALWIDSYAGDDFRHNYRLAGTLMAAGDLENGDGNGTGEERVESTVPLSIFKFHENGPWTEVAMDEEEGKIAVGCADGTITILEYS